MGTMDIRKQRLIKQCQVVLGEDFDKDFIYEDVDFSNARALFKAYKLYEAKEEGTDELVSQFKKDTPGEIDEMFELDRKGSTATYGFLSKNDLKAFEKIAKKHGLRPNRFSKPGELKRGGKKYFTMTYTGKVDKLISANKEGNKVIRGIKEYVGPALTPANQIAKKYGGKVKSIMVKDDKGKKSKYFYVEKDELEEADGVLAAKNELEEKKIAGLVKKAEKSGISYGILKQVYNRGMAAWKTGHRPGTTPQQWAFARVNSFITGGKTRKTADADLWAKTKK